MGLVILTQLVHVTTSSTLSTNMRVLAPSHLPSSLFSRLPQRKWLGDDEDDGDGGDDD